MWLTYIFGALAALAAAAAWFCWRLYKDAIQREIASTEVLCAVLLEPMLHIEFQNIAYARTNARFPAGSIDPSEIEVALLQQELIRDLGNSAFRYASEHGFGATLRRILTGPFIVGRNPDELWRYTKA